MANKVVVLKLKCPKCGCPARAEVKKQLYKFLIYVCPKCESNVVYYDNKTDIISDKLVESMAQKNKLQYSGQAVFPKKPKKQKSRPNREKTGLSGGITPDNIVDLKILLNTEKDFDSFLSQI